MEYKTKEKIVCKGWDTVPNVIYSNCVIDISQLSPIELSKSVKIKMLENTKLTLIGEKTKVYSNISIELVGGNILELHSMNLSGNEKNCPLIVRGWDNHIYPSETNMLFMPRGHHGMWVEETASFVLYITNGSLESEII